MILPNSMTLLRKREYGVLLIGDVFVFVLSLWAALWVRYLDMPGVAFFTMHLMPFAFLFAAWVGVYFLAGLYGKHTRLFRSRLVATLLSVQVINVVIAALFFWLIPAFVITPRFLLIVYLLVSSLLIVLWRAIIFPHLRGVRPLRGVLIATGPDARLLAQEVGNDAHYPFRFEYVLDTAHAPSHEVIQRACRIAEEDGVQFLAADVTDTAVSAALPIIYDAAFHKRRFALINVSDLYQEVFERVPLSLVRYEWILQHAGSSDVYDSVKRLFDIVGAAAIGIISLVFYPLIVLAIKLDDGGPVFITQERVGRFQHPIRIYKFRSMSGNDNGRYGENGVSALRVTRAGRWLRVLRLDELPQIWNVLRGDLSLVGPRPELPSLAAQYSARIPYYNARYLLAPGLMGWAQLKHDRHPHHGTAVEETKEKLSYDLYYLKHRSLLLDIYILLQTVRIVLTARGS